MEITDVAVFGAVPADPCDCGPFEGGVVRPLEIYQEFRQTGPDYGLPLSGCLPAAPMFVEIRTDTGPTGLYGPFRDDRPFHILHRLRPFLLGRDPLAVERLWDQMFRLDTHARRGASMWALSAVDCALWDLRGKYYGAPVYALLGGPTREAVPAYASTHGLSDEPQRVRERAGWLRQAGYAGQKWFFRYGPGDGEQGRRRNLALARAASEGAGEGTALMFDAWAGWDMPYALEMARAIRPLRPRWIEEPVSTDLGPEPTAEFRRRSGLPVAAGEHLCTRWDMLPLLQAQAVDYLQPDPDWCGGITELVKIATLASTFGVGVIPHGCNIHPAAHVIASQSPAVCPVAEYLVRHQKLQQHLNRTPWQASDGHIALPEAPGLGYELDAAKVEKRVELNWPQ